MLLLPCATENEIHKAEAETLVKNGCMAVCEGANMPTTIDGYHIFKEAGILYAAGKSRQRGWCRNFGTRNVAEQHAPSMVTRRKLTRGSMKLWSEFMIHVLKLLNDLAHRAIMSMAPISPASLKLPMR